jgi:ankyrin repeat protein
MHFASTCGNYFAVVFINSIDPECSLAKDRNKWTPLHLACWSGYVQVVKLLMRRDGSTITKDDAGRSCAHYAAWNSHNDVLKALDETYSDVLKWTDNEGWTPADVAHWKGHVGTEKYLMNLVAKARSA